MPEYISPRSGVGAPPAAQNGVHSAPLSSSGSSNSTPAATTGKTVLIDNYDSFTYNVVEVSAVPICVL